VACRGRVDLTADLAQDASMARDARRKTGIYRGGLDDAPISTRAKVVVVHDASRPIARAVALALADRGQCVLACGTDPFALTDLPRETAPGGLIEATAMPAGQRLARALALFGRVDIIVAVAELEPELLFGAFEMIDPDALIATALSSPLTFVNELMPPLTRNHGGRIIFVNALPALPFAAAAAAARAGIDGAAEALRLELAPSNIEVIVVAPELAAPPAPAATPLDALEQALLRLPAASPQHVLAGPLRALLARASTHEAIAAETVSALLAARPKPRIVVRAGSLLRGVRATRALEREASRARRRDPSP